MLAICGSLGLVRGTRVPLVAAVFAVALVCSVQVVRIADELVWPESHGVSGCSDLDECAPFLAPALRELKADILKTREASRPGFELLGGDDGYRARDLAAWRWLESIALVLAPWAFYRLLRLRLGSVGSFAIVVATIFLVLAWLALRAFSTLE